VVFSTVFYLGDSIRSYPSEKLLLSLPIHRTRHAHTLIHLRPGPSVVTGFDLP